MIIKCHLNLSSYLLLNSFTETRPAEVNNNNNNNCSFLQIPADQYASRSDMLSSIVVAWSPVLCLSSKICTAAQNVSSPRFSIFAVGGKSGKISIWRIHAPQCYSIEHSRVSPGVVLVGILQAHISWVTAINLALLGSKANNQVLLASASSDGR